MNEQISEWRIDWKKEWMNWRKESVNEWINWWLTFEDWLDESMMAIVVIGMSESDNEIALFIQLDIKLLNQIINDQTTTGNTPPTGTKENDTSLHLEMMDQFWKQFQRELLNRFCYLKTLSWWDQYVGLSITSYVNQEIWNCKNLWLWCFNNISSYSCQI